MNDKHILVQGGGRGLTLERHLLGVIAGLDTENTGLLFDWAGKRIPP